MPVLTSNCKSKNNGKTEADPYGMTNKKGNDKCDSNDSMVGFNIL